MGYETQAIRGVKNHYGTRGPVSGAGAFTANGSERVYEITIDETALTEFLPELTIYKGEIIKEATIVGIDQYTTTGGTFDLTLTPADGVGTVVDYAVLETELEVAPDVSAAIASMAAVTAVVPEDCLLSITSVAGTFATYGKVKIQIKTDRVV